MDTITAEVAAAHNSVYYKSVLDPAIHSIMEQNGFEYIDYEVQILPVYRGRKAHCEGRRYFHYKCTSQHRTGKQLLKWFELIQTALHEEVNRRCDVNFSAPKQVSFADLPDVSE
jgi:hypothetical protein